jgi:hypothetical protein
MARSMRLTDGPFPGSSNRLDRRRRTICNLALLDRVLSPSFKMPCYIDLAEVLPEPYPDTDWTQDGRLMPGTQKQLDAYPRIINQIYRLSGLLCALTIHYRKSARVGILEDYEQRHLEWQRRLEPDLIYHVESIDTFRKLGALRPYIFMHLLYNHIGQLLYFPALNGWSQRESNAARDQSRVALCQYHASRITEIVGDGWKLASIDIHNVCCGQILTVAAVVQMYSCLTSSLTAQKEASRAHIEIIIASFLRMRQHCRIFDRMVGCIFLYRLFLLHGAN